MTDGSPMRVTGPSRGVGPEGSGLRGAVRGFLPIFIIVSLVVTPAAVILAIAMTGGGDPQNAHYGTAMALFPYSALGIMGLQWLPRGLFIALALAQYPIYGLVLDIFLWKRKMGRALLILGGLHLVATAIALSGVLALPVIK